MVGLHDWGSSHLAAVINKQGWSRDPIQKPVSFTHDLKLSQKEIQVASPLRDPTRAPSFALPAQPSLDSTQVPTLTSTDSQFGRNRKFATYGYKVAPGQTETAKICPLELEELESISE